MSQPPTRHFADRTILTQTYVKHAHPCIHADLSSLCADLTDAAGSDHEARHTIFMFMTCERGMLQPLCRPCRYWFRMLAARFCSSQGYIILKVET